MNSRNWAFALCVFWLAFYATAYLLSLPPMSGDLLAGTSGFVILAGGPLCLAAGTILAIFLERPAGGLLWLGGALAALGIALESGPHLGRYFLGMALIVLPQVAAGSLFLLHARKQASTRPAPRR